MFPSFLHSVFKRFESFDLASERGRILVSAGLKRLQNNVGGVQSRLDLDLSGFRPFGDSLGHSEVRRKSSQEG